MVAILSGVRREGVWGGLQAGNQGGPRGWDLLVQEAEQHGALVALGHAAEGVENPGLQVVDVLKALLAVQLGEVGGGFVQGLHRHLQDWREENEQQRPGSRVSRLIHRRHTEIQHFTLEHRHHSFYISQQLPY